MSLSLDPTTLVSIMDFLHRGADMLDQAMSVITTFGVLVFTVVLTLLATDTI